MSRIFLLVIIAICLPFRKIHGQTIPVINQMLSDGFLYNPSLTGLSGGSSTFTFKKLWTGIDQSPVVSLASVHGLVARDRIGVGGNIYYEKVNIFQNFFSSVDASYHLPLKKNLGISFGLAGEIFRTQLNSGDIFVKDPDDPLLTDIDDRYNLDVSFGVNLSHPWFNAGFSANRIGTMLGYIDKNRAFSSYFSSHANVFIPVRNGFDEIQPSLLYRKNSEGQGQLDAMVFYTYDNLLILGALFRTGSIMGFSAGFNVKSRFVLGYTIEMLAKGTQLETGPSHEFSLRYNFNKQYYRDFDPDNNLPAWSFPNREKSR